MKLVNWLWVAENLTALSLMSFLLSQAIFLRSSAWSDWGAIFAISAPFFVITYFLGLSLRVFGRAAYGVPLIGSMAGYIIRCSPDRAAACVAGVCALTLGSLIFKEQCERVPKRKAPDQN